MASSAAGTARVSGVVDRLRLFNRVSTKNEPKPTTWLDFTTFSQTLRKMHLGNFLGPKSKGAFWAAFGAAARAYLP